MRLWSLHPRYLDRQGLVALWREALLARAVLNGQTRGYRYHPQLARFRAQARPAAAIGAYLRSVHEEALVRGYAFDRSKLVDEAGCPAIAVTSGQLDHEWRHLRRKLLGRSPGWLEQWQDIGTPDPHPLFRVEPGPIEAWERPIAIS